MSLKDDYKEIRKIINSFIKKDYWNIFSSVDIFYNFYDSKKTLLTFLDSCYADSYGIQLVFNRDGFNYIHDIFTTSDMDYSILGDCDCICAVLISKSNLKKEEREFLLSNNFRIKEENNLIVCRFKKGYGPRLANAKEMKIMFEQLDFISCLIMDHYNEIIKAFKEENSVISMVNSQNRSYTTTYGPLLYLEENPRKMPINKPFAEEFLDACFVDDECYLFTGYLPLIIKENNVRPLLLCFYYPKLGKSYFKYMTTEHKDHKNCIWGILYETFTNIGLPTKMYIDNRDIYHYVVKTLEAIKMEVDFKKELLQLNHDIGQIIGTMYLSTNDQIYEEKEAIELLIDTIAKVMNDTSLDEYEDEVDEDDDSYVS